MNRYKGTLRIWTGEGAKEHPEWCTYEDNEWMRADEVDEVIMNMVSEFAETAKDYESEQTKAKEEIARLRKALEYYGDSNIYFADGGVLAREALAEKE